MYGLGLPELLILCAVKLLVTMLLLGWIPALIAKRKGREFVPWWFYGGSVFIVALIHSFFLSDKEEGRDRKEKKTEKLPLQETPDSALVITDLLSKYDIIFRKGKYYWKGEEYDSYKIPLTKAQNAAFDG
ncbi:MAG: hypothetical protein D3914_08785 [Candidatus Electrothrix sp. LOE2]|nr:hypothetical protein [Candidatus Electrothrix sp. LOE2]